MNTCQKREELFHKVMQVLENSKEFPHHKEYLENITSIRLPTAMAKRLKWEITMAWISPEEALEAFRNGNHQLIVASAERVMELKELRKKFCNEFDLYKV